MGRDTFLTVKSELKDPVEGEVLQRKIKLAVAQGNRAEEQNLRLQLRRLYVRPDEEAFPTFQAISPEIKNKSLVLLLNHLKAFYTKVTTPEAGVKIAKEVIIELYEGAQRALGTYVPVTVPPPLLLQDPEVRKKIIWQDMVIVDEDDWDSKPVVDEVLEALPSLVPREELDELQLAVYREMVMVGEVVEFIHYWSSKGRVLELQTEIIS